MGRCWGGWFFFGALQRGLAAVADRIPAPQKPYCTGRAPLIEHPMSRGETPLIDLGRTRFGTSLDNKNLGPGPSTWLYFGR